MSRYPISSPPHSSTAYTRAYYARGKLSQITSRKALFISTFIGTLQSALQTAHRAPGTAPGTTALPAARLTQRTAPGTAPGTAQRAATRSAARAATRSTRLFTLLFTALLTAFFCTFTVSSSAFAYAPCQTQLNTISEYDLRPRSDLQFDDGGWTNDVIPQVFTLGELSTVFGDEQAFGLSDYIPHVNKQNMYETLTEEDLKHGIAPTMKLDRQNMTVQTYELKLQGYDKEWRNGTKVSALIYYGYIGTYRGVPIRGRLFVDGEYQKVWKNLDKPYMQVASKFIGGIALFNVKNVRISYQIDPVMTDNEAYYMLEYGDRSFVTISSLAYRQSYSPTYSINNIDLPFNKVPSDMAILHHSVRKVEYMNDAGFNSTEIDRSEWDQPTHNESFQARCKVLYPSAEKGSDNPRDPGFKKRSFTAYCSSMFLGTLFPYVEWVNLSSAHVGRQATVAPLIKTSKSAQIQTLDQVEFDLEQKVDSLGFTTFNRFNEMELTFEIPREVQCQSIEMLQGVRGFNAPLDKKAGTLVHNKETNTITFTFNKEWLQKTMPLRGEKYIIHVKGRVISPSKKSSARKENKAENPYKALELKASCKTYGDPVTSTKTLTRAPNDKKSIPIETLEPAQYHEATPVPKANHGALVGVSLSANPQAGSYIQPKERITYTLDVTNNALNAQNCTITMPLPKHMHYIETLQTGNPQVQQTRKGSTLEWNLKNLEPGSHTKLNFVAESDADCAVYGSKLFTQASYSFTPAVVEGNTKPKNQTQAHSSSTASSTATGTAGATSSAGATGAASVQSAPSNASAVYYSNPLVHTTKQNDKAAPCIDVTLISDKKAGAALKADEAITYTIQVKDLMNASAQKEKSSVYVVVPLGTRLDNAEIIALPKNAASAQKAFYDVANHCIQWDISELSPGQTLSLSYKARALRYPTSAPINQQALFTVHNALHNTNEIQYSNALLHNALSGSFLQNGVSAGTQTDTTITGDMKVPGVSSGTQTDAPAPGVSSGTQTDTTITGDMKVPGVSSGTQTDAPAPGVASGTQTDTSTGVSTETQTEPSTGVSTETQTDPSTGVASGTQTDSSSGVETGTQTNPSTGVSIDTQTDTPSGTTSTSGSGTNPQAGTTGGTSTPDSTSTPTGTHNTGNDAGGSTNSQGSQSHGKKPPKQHGQTPSETTPHKNENGNNTGNSNGSTSGNGTGQGTGNGSSTSNASGNNTSSTSTSTTSGTQGTTSSTNTTPGGSQNQGTTSQNDQNHPSTSAPETSDKIPNASKLLYPLAPENRWYVDFKAAAKLLSNYLDLRPETLSQMWHSLHNGKSGQSRPHQPNGKDTPGKQGEQNTLHPTVEQVLEHLANASEKDMFSSLFPQHNTQTASGSGTGAGQQSDTSHQPGTGTTSGTSTGTNTGTGTSVGTGTDVGTGTTGSGAGAGASTGTGANTNSGPGTGAGTGASTGTNTGAGTNAQAGTHNNSGANAGTDTGTNGGTGTDMGTGATGANTNSEAGGTGANTGANGADTSASQSQNNASTSTNAQNGSALSTGSHNNTARNGNANGSASSTNAGNPSLSHANASGTSAGANQSNNAGNAVNAANNANGSANGANGRANGANGNSTSANGLSNGNVGNAGSAANPGSNGIAGNAGSKKSLPTFALSAGNSLVEESDAQEEQRGGGEQHRAQRLRKTHTEKSQKFKGFNGDNGTKIAKNLLKHKLFPQTGSSIVPFVLLSLTLLLSGAFCFIYATRSTLKERFGYGYSQQEKEITIPRA